MITDLDDTLVALFQRELPEALVEQVQISFATPGDDFPPQSVLLPAIDLFLYDIRENRELRSTETYVERNADGTATRTRAPIRVDFSYLVTAWPSDGVPDAARDEHRLLSEALRVLIRHPELPADILQGELRGQGTPPPTTSLQPGRLQSVGEFWQAISDGPKATLSFTVTLAAPRGEVDTVHLVTEKVLELGQVR